MRGDGTEYGVDVSGAGKVLGAHRDDEGDDDNDSEDRAESAALKGARFDAHEAALVAATKGTVTEVDADDDSGAVAWNVETVKAGTTSEWRVALDTGKITRVQSDED